MTPPLCPLILPYARGDEPTFTHLRLQYGQSAPRTQWQVKWQGGYTALRRIKRFGSVEGMSVSRVSVLPIIILSFAVQMIFIQGVVTTGGKN